MKNQTSLLAIDPGLREIGFAHFIGRELVDHGVKSMRRPNRRPVDVLTQTMNRLLTEKTPEIVVIATNSFSQIQQNLPVMIAIQRIRAIARRHGVTVYEFASNTIKKEVTGDGRATKRAIAKVICAQFPELRPYFGSNCRWRERYYQNMFDAVAVGLTYLAVAKQSKLSHYALTQ
jgi:Holliday junction resolvasome RuvABC endonuclease subunit